MSHPYRRRDKAGDRRAFEPVSGALALLVWQAGQPRGGHCFLPRYVLAFLVALVDYVSFSGAIPCCCAHTVYPNGHTILRAEQSRN
jgi:hypothetical protein